MLRGACSCARGAACKLCCAATAIVAIATAAGSAGAWRASPLGARAHVDTKGLGGAGLSTPSVRGAGASGAVRAVMVAMVPVMAAVMAAVMAPVVPRSRT